MTNIKTHCIVVSDDAPESVVREAIRIKAESIGVSTELNDIKVIRESELRQEGAQDE